VNGKGVLWDVLVCLPVGVGILLFIATLRIDGGKKRCGG